MRIGSMIDLADCVLIVDGQRIPLSTPPSAPEAARSGAWAFGVRAGDVEFLASQLGRGGIVQTRNGVVLLRLRIRAVDETLNVLTGEAQRR